MKKFVLSKCNIIFTVKIFNFYFKDRTQQRFEEQPVGDYFPELQNLPSKYD